MTCYWEQYLLNMERYIQLENRIVINDCSDSELLDQLHETAEEKRVIQREQDAILSEHLVPLERGVCSLTPDGAKELSEFAEKLTRRSGSVDSMISYRIHLILLEYARALKDYDGIAEQLYGCGLCESYIRQTHLGEQMCRHFTEAIEYRPYYGQMTAVGRGYLERCLCNHLLNFTSRTPARLIEEGERILRIFDGIEQEYGAMVTDSKMLRSAVYRNMLTAAVGFRAGEDATPENTNKIFRYSQLVMEEVKTEQKRNMSLLAQYPNCYYAEFHAGRIDLDTLLAKLETIMTEDPSLDRLPNCLRVYNNTSGYLEYLTRYSPKSRQEIEAIAREKAAYVMQFTALLKKDEQTDTANRYLANFVSTAFSALPYRQALQILLQVTIGQHKPTCIHTLVVDRLCQEILTLVLAECPERLAGVNGYSEEEIPDRREELMRIMHGGALLHDIGKYRCFSVISNASRKLDDIEFGIIKQHPVEGCDFIKNAHLPSAVRDCVVGHHVWHNGRGGYPVNLPPTKNQPLVDILSVADSLDAATDLFGRSYANPKPVSVLIEEFSSQRDTRYAGFVIDVLKTTAGQCMLERVLNEERRAIVCLVWRDWEGGVVSKEVVSHICNRQASGNESSASVAM